MIFVTVGTQDKQFTRLLKMVEDAIVEGNIQEEVIVQAGHTIYNSDKMKILNYIPYNEFNKYIEAADIIITHGGVGSILSGVKIGKKVIAVARLEKYNEHINDHQLQVIEKMAEGGYIISCSENEPLLSKIKMADTFVPQKFVSNTENFINGFEKVLDSLLEDKK